MVKGKWGATEAFDRVWGARCGYRDGPVSLAYLEKIRTLLLEWLADADEAVEAEPRGLIERLHEERAARKAG